MTGGEITGGAHDGLAFDTALDVVAVAVLTASGGSIIGSLSIRRDADALSTAEVIDDALVSMATDIMEPQP